MINQQKNSTLEINKQSFLAVLYGALGYQIWNLYGFNVYAQAIAGFFFV